MVGNYFPKKLSTVYCREINHPTNQDMEEKPATNPRSNCILSVQSDHPSIHPSIKSDVFCPHIQLPPPIRTYLAFQLYVQWDRMLTDIELGLRRSQVEIEPQVKSQVKISDFHLINSTLTRHRPPVTHHPCFFLPRNINIRNE